MRTAHVLAIACYPLVFLPMCAWLCESNGLLFWPFSLAGSAVFAGLLAAVARLAKDARTAMVMCLVPPFLWFCAVELVLQWSRVEERVEQVDYAPWPNAPGYILEKHIPSLGEVVFFLALGAVFALLVGALTAIRRRRIRSAPHSP